MNTTLHYAGTVLIDDLTIGECTVHRAANGDGRWWLLWLRVRRDDTGDPIDVAVPINPGGEYIAEGPGGKTWGLQRSDSGTWQVSPSINVLVDQVHPGPHDAPSMWHQTPRIVDVPDDAPWISSSA